MILVEIRPTRGRAKPVPVHPRVTVVDPKGRKPADLAAAIGRALRGEGGDVDVTAEVGGRRQRVTRDLAASAPPAVVVLASELPHPVPADHPGGGDGAGAGGELPGSAGDRASKEAGRDAQAAAEAAIAAAESAVADSRAALQSAETAWSAAERALAEAQREAGSIDVGAARAALEAAEARLEVAEAGAAAARRSLVETREAADREAAEARAADSARRDRIAELEARRRDLIERRDELEGALRDLGDAPDPRVVSDALAALRRLRDVKPKPSPRAARLADRWASVTATLAELPAPPAPPEWLETPALAALVDARRALADAEAGGPSASVDPARVADLERAHAELIEAEQRAMKKGSRLNRRRLEQAEEAERQALQALGLGSYGEFLQNMAPLLDDDGSADEGRVAEARAALADAEAVWEELHGGTVDPAWTAAREEQARIRADAAGIVDDDCPDTEVEARLRSHLEAVVDTGWAEDALRDALAAVGVDPGEDPGEDLEAAAEAWLADAPARHEQVAIFRDQREAVLGALAEAEAEIERLGSQVVRPDGPLDDRPAEERSGALSPTDPFEVLEAALRESEQAEQEARAAVEAARSQIDQEAASRARMAEIEAGGADRRAALDTARARVAQAEAALDAARRAAGEAAADALAAAGGARAPKGRRERGGPAAGRTARRSPEGRPAMGGSPDGGAAGADGGARRSPVVTEAVLLARLAAAVREGSPVVVDGHVLVEQPASARRRLLGLLDRAGDRVQVVVVGGGDLVTWGRSLGNRAAARSL